MDDLSEDSITSTFDQLVQEDVILYSPYTVIKHEENGYPMEFRICPSLTRKPHTTTSQIDPAFAKTRKWGPGSDMYCPDERLILAKPNGTHDLALNLFCVDRPQLMMLTCDSYRRQDQCLDTEDFDVILQVVRKLPSMYVIYNCAKNGGCSRMHKHIQGLRGPPYAFDVLVNNPEKVPFKFFTHRFEQGFGAVEVEKLLAAYEVLLDKVRKVLGLAKDDVCPHNFALWKDWMIVIPRRSAHVGEASANTAGMLGSVWLSDKVLADQWITMGSNVALVGLGVPREVDGEA